MKGLGRKASFLVLMAVLATGLVGAAYTLWYENLGLNATVSTGTLDVDWTTPSYYRTISINQGETFIPRYTPNSPIPDSKYVQVCSIPGGESAPLERDPATDNGNEETLRFNLTGAYPYAGCRFDVRIVNRGTVPAHFNLAAMSVDSHLGIFAEGDARQPGHPASDAYCAALFNPPAGSPIPGSDVNGLQLHTNETLYCWVTVYALQSAAENATYTATWTVTGHQWNETAASVP